MIDEDAYSYVVCLREINYSGLYKWQTFLSKGKRLLAMKIITIFFATMATLSLLFGPSTTYATGMFNMALIAFGIYLLAASVFLWNQDYAYVAFFLGVSVLALGFFPLMFIIIFYWTSIIYKLLKVRQIKKAYKISKMTPAELAKIGTEEPRVQVTIRGGGK